MKQTTFKSDHCWKLPPLILHPFSDSNGPNKLAESSRASLMLQGLLSTNGHSPEQLELSLLEGRWHEIRMLYYVGKDVGRWIEQCGEVIERESELMAAGVCSQSFAALLVYDTPVIVRDKLKQWGVIDYKAIFARALGLNAIFADAPFRELLTDRFVRNYYTYADHMFNCYQGGVQFPLISAQNFDFDLFASGEYSRMLERQFQAG